MTNLREIAFHCLRSGEEDPLRTVDRSADAHGLEARDRSLLRRILGSEVRRRATLRALVQYFTGGRAKPDLAAHLRLGLAQLLFLDRVPAHAVLAETVRATMDTLGLSKGRIANGVLRSAQRALREGHCGDPRRDLPGRELSFEMQVFRDPVEHPLLWIEDALNIPGHLAKRWTARYGANGCETLARWFLDEPPLVLQDDGLLEPDKAFLLAQGARLHLGGYRLPAEATPWVIESELFQAGRAHIQGDSACAVVREIAAPTAGDLALELCAAPGTKALQLARAGCTVLALDRSAKRLAPILKEAERLKVRRSVQPAASENGEALAQGASFDLVLLDAPCSNTGVLGARPGARWRFGPASLASLGEVQRRLLERGAAHTKVGGRLIWSVCSLEPEEGPQLLKQFLANQAGFVLEQAREFLPGPEGPVDGGYSARLVRRS